MANNPPPYLLHPEWFTEQIVPGVDPTVPGIYEWRVDGLSVYIGQYTHASRPRREYARNILNLLNGRPYRKGKPLAFRSIHVQLGEAVRTGRTITLTLVENQADKTRRNQRERELEQERRAGRRV